MAKQAKKVNTPTHTTVKVDTKSESKGYVIPDGYVIRVYGTVSYNAEDKTHEKRRRRIALDVDMSGVKLDVVARKATTKAIIEVADVLRKAASSGDSFRSFLDSWPDEHWTEEEYKIRNDDGTVTKATRKVPLIVRKFNNMRERVEIPKTFAEQKADMLKVLQTATAEELAALIAEAQKLNAEAAKAEATETEAAGNNAK